MRRSAACVSVLVAFDSTERGEDAAGDRTGGPGDEAFLGLLRRRRFSTDLAREVTRVGQELRALTQTQGREFAAAFDVATGMQVGAAVAGEGERVVIRELLRAMVRGRPYLFLHTHRSNGTFSLRDVAVLVASPDLHAAAVATVQGHWFLMTKRRSASEVDEFDVQLAFERARAALGPAYAMAVASHKMTLDEGNRRMQHAIWQLITDALYLRYDWTEADL